MTRDEALRKVHRWADPSLLVDALAGLGVLKLDEPSDGGAHRALAIALDTKGTAKEIVNSLRAQGFVITKEIDEPKEPSFRRELSGLEALDVALNFRGTICLCSPLTATAVAYALKIQGYAITKVP
jgi:hypothetical protein